MKCRACDQELPEDSTKRTVHLTACGLQLYWLCPVQDCNYEVTNRRYYDLNSQHWPKSHPDHPPTEFRWEQRPCLEHRSPTRTPKGKDSSRTRRSKRSSSGQRTREPRKRSKESPRPGGSASSSKVSGSRASARAETRAHSSCTAESVSRAAESVSHSAAPVHKSVVSKSQPVVSKSQPRALVRQSPVPVRQSPVPVSSHESEVDVVIHYEATPSPPPRRSPRKHSQPRRSSSGVLEGVSGQTREQPPSDTEVQAEEARAAEAIAGEQEEAAPDTPGTPETAQFTFMDLAGMIPSLSEDQWEAVLREAPRRVLLRVARERATTASSAEEPGITIEEPVAGTSRDRRERTTTLTTTATCPTTTTTTPPTQVTTATTPTTTPAMATVDEVREVVRDLQGSAGRGRPRSARTQADFPTSVLPTEGRGLLIRSGHVTISIEGPVRHLHVAPE